jgi:hypothetical protein
VPSTQIVQFWIRAGSQLATLFAAGEDAGDAVQDTARERLEESVRLRREIGLMPGVAANLVGLAYVAAGQGRRDDALALVEEAGAIAAASGAHAILRHVEEASARLQA